MQTHSVTNFPRRRVQDERQSALSYWSGVAAFLVCMLLICIFAGLRI